MSLQMNWISVVRRTAFFGLHENTHASLIPVGNWE